MKSAKKIMDQILRLLFLIGDTFGHRRIGPSYLDEILAACLVQTEYWSSVLNTEQRFSTYVQYPVHVYSAFHFAPNSAFSMFLEVIPCHGM